MKVHILPLVVSLKSSFTTDLLGFLLLFCMTLILLKSLAGPIVLDSAPQSGFVVIVTWPDCGGMDLQHFLMTAPHKWCPLLTTGARCRVIRYRYDTRDDLVKVVTAPSLQRCIFFFPLVITYLWDNTLWWSGFLKAINALESIHNPCLLPAGNCSVFNVPLLYLWGCIFL